MEATIADRLQYLQETKKQIKNAITEKGVSVADTDTFRSYADKIKSIQNSEGVSSEYFGDTIVYSDIANIGWISLIKKFTNSVITVDTSSPGYLFSYFPNLTIPKMTFAKQLLNLSSFFRYSKLKQIDFTIFAEDIDTSEVANMTYMFASCYDLENLNLSNFNTSKTTRMTNMFDNCLKLKSLNLGANFNTTKVNNMSFMFNACPKLEAIPKLNASGITTISSFCTGSTELVDLGGLENLGQAYSTTQSANYNAYRLNLSTNNKLTHESLMNVINNLYDIATKGCKAQNLQLGAENIAKLTEEEIAIATEKGWTVS